MLLIYGPLCETPKAPRRTESFWPEITCMEHQAQSFQSLPFTIESISRNKDANLSLSSSENEAKKSRARSSEMATSNCGLDKAPDSKTTGSRHRRAAACSTVSIRGFPVPFSKDCMEEREIPTSYANAVMDKPRLLRRAFMVSVRFFRNNITISPFCYNKRKHF
jgi:hypothetical protein